MLAEVLPVEEVQSGYLGGNAHYDLFSTASYI